MFVDIKFTKHAFKRLSKRCCKFGMNIVEAEEKARRTIRYGKPFRVKQKHRHSLIYYHYFNEGFSFYVPCRLKIKEGCRRFEIKTVIIKWGRR